MNICYEKGLGRALNPRGGRRTRAGLTLIELIIAIGVLTVVLLYTMLALMSLVRLNRLTAIEVAATNAVRSQIEELMTVARDNVGEDGVTNQARAALHYYGSNFTGESVALGPNDGMVRRTVLDADGKTLVYRFAVPEPGESTRELASGDSQGLPLMSRRGVGTMIIYLTEPDVPPLSAYPQFNFMWTDLGDGDPYDTGPVAGFDMNRDGHIDNLNQEGETRPKITQGMLDSGSALENSLDIAHLPVDIVVTYYTTAAHGAQEYQLTRRVIVM